jgi:hypothetical protein
VKKQQMRLTMAGAHRLQGVRTRVLNQQLRKDFERGHPQLGTAADPDWPILIALLCSTRIGRAP